MCCNLPLGAGCEAFFTTPTAKIVEHALLYHTRRADGQDAIWIDVPPGRAAALLQYLERYHIAEQFEIADRTAEFGQFHLAGPTARKVLESAIGEPIPNLEPLQHMERSIGSSVCHIRENEPLGVSGYDLVFLADRAAAIRQSAHCRGRRSRWDRNVEILAVEAGTPSSASIWMKTASSSRSVVRMRFVTPRAAISARSRSSWPAIGLDTSIARSAA